MHKFKINYDKTRVAETVERIKVVACGGIPDRVPAGALVSETPARVREIARRNLEACKPSGGFIYATSHSIMPQAKFENYQVMLEILREYGQYEKNA